jgi:hypothetical protein
MYLKKGIGAALLYTTELLYAMQMTHVNAEF